MLGVRGCWGWGSGVESGEMVCRVPTENLENLENENCHGKVMECETLAKSHEISLSVMEFSFTNFVPKLFQILFCFN